MGSDYFPWGPHGPRGSPFEPKPATTPAMPVQEVHLPSNTPAAGPPLHFGSYAPTADGCGYAVGPGTISRGTKFVVSAIIVGVFWQFFICLYPMPALAAGFAAVFCAGFLVRTVLPLVSPLNVLLVQIVGYAVAIAAWYVAMRLEQKLARYIWYRIPRNIVRLIMFAILAINGVENNTGIPLFSWTNPALIPKNIANILTTPDYLIFVFAFVLMMQLILWKADQFRVFWHSCLAGLGLWKS